MLKNPAVALIFFSFLALQADAREPDVAISVEGLAYAELKSAILLGEEHGLDRGALILTLGYADHHSARKVLVEIVDYYFGAAVVEAMVASVSRHGESIVGEIERALSHDSTCVESELTRCVSEPERRKLLRYLKEIAESGELVEYVW